MTGVGFKKLAAHPYQNYPKLPPLQSLYILGSYFKVKVQNGGIYIFFFFFFGGGGVKISNIFLWCLKFLITYMGVNGRRWSRTYI